MHYSGSSGVISLDDVSFSPSCRIDPNAIQPCPSTERACTDGTCIAAEKFCNFVVSVLTDYADISFYQHVYTLTKFHTRVYVHIVYIS